MMMTPDANLNLTIKPPYKAKAVANYFLRKAEEEANPLTQMKLQKLVYFAHGWHLALLDGPLIDERIQAWQFGPVVRTVYDEFKGFGKDPIKGRATSLEPFNGKLHFFEPEIPEADKQTRQLLDRVWEVYKRLSAYQLSSLTHEPGTPWEQTYSADPGVRNLAIADEAIKTFFQKAANANKERAAAN